MTSSLLSSSSSSSASIKTILTLPKTDLDISQQQQGITTTTNPSISNNNDTHSNDDTNDTIISNDNNNNDHHLNHTDPLILLQLPINWNTNDLMDSQFVIKRTSTEHNNLDNNNNNSNNNSTSIVSLVSESKCISYDVYRVETSNALVLIPPPIISSSVTNDSNININDDCTSDTKKRNDNDNKNDENDPNHCNNVSMENNGNKDDGYNNINNNKRIKMMTTTDSTTATTTIGSTTTTESKILLSRLVKPGGCGASFLELRPRKFRLYDLEQLIPTYNGHDNGITIQELAYTLQVSTYQIQIALRYIDKAYPFNNNNEDNDCFINTNKEEETQQSSETETPSSTIIKTTSIKSQPSLLRYLLLSEEILLICYSAILDTLTEEKYNYITRIDNKFKFLDHVYQRICPEDLLALLNHDSSHTNSYDDNDDSNNKERLMKSILLFCIHQLDQQSYSSSNQASSSSLQLCVSKIAKHVAVRIFLRHTDNTNDHHMNHGYYNEDYFLNIWQSELPGIGKSYQVDTIMLRGIAIRVAVVNATTTSYHWKYYPKDNVLPKDITIQQCIDILYLEKDLWLLEEIIPYIERFIEFDHNNDNTNNGGDYYTKEMLSTANHILLQYTKITYKDMNGISVSYYQKK